MTNVSDYAESLTKLIDRNGRKTTVTNPNLKTVTTYMYKSGSSTLNTSIVNGTNRTDFGSIFWTRIDDSCCEKQTAYVDPLGHGTITNFDEVGCVKRSEVYWPFES